MSRIRWWLVDVVSRALEADEQNAVRGDFAESKESAGSALRGVMGLVVRRQAALWKHWQPWVILTVLVAPLAVLLSVVSRLAAGQNATYIWLYANNWDWALLRYKEFWYEFGDSVWFVFMKCLPLVCWSWTAGFVLGSVSRRLVPANAVLFCIALLLGELFAAPTYLASWLLYVHPPDQNDPVSTLGFYRAVFPLIVLTVLVAIPSLRGMRWGRGLARFRPILRTAIWAAAIAALIVLVIQEPGVGFFLAAYRHPGIWQSWQVHVLQFVVYWPVAYVISNNIARRWPRIHV
jgi:hypothetical protein